VAVANEWAWWCKQDDTIFDFFRELIQEEGTLHNTLQETKAACERGDFEVPQPEARLAPS
jgi:hypothetical protein